VNSGPVAQQGIPNHSWHMTVHQFSKRRTGSNGVLAIKQKKIDINLQ
jgi:hypothetical protein